MEIDREDLGKGIQKCFDSHDAAAIMHIPILAQTLKDNPKEGISLIYPTYETGLNQAYTRNGHNNRAFIQGLAGGPMETVPWAVYNAVGDVYPLLERKDRFGALRQVLRCLDQNNTQHVQDTHTRGIREPLLLTDIAVVRPVYWPGLEEGQFKIKQYESFEELKENLIDENGMFKRDKVESDFIMGWTLLCSAWSRWSEDYAKVANPKFLERTVKGLVNYCFAKRTDPKSIRQEIADFKTHLPEQFHSRIAPLVKEKDWPDYKEFK